MNGKEEVLDPFFVLLGPILLLPHGVKSLNSQGQFLTFSPIFIPIFAALIYQQICWEIFAYF
nr:MAG TPA: hypothetical protein [Caudoviricetes sp.]